MWKDAWPFAKRWFIVPIAGIVGFFSTVFGFFDYHPAAPSTYGDCKLRPQTASNIKIAQEYFRQGVHYVGQGNPQLALWQFQEVSRIDPNFLGANLNIGSAYLAQEKYQDAQESLQKEVQVISCLASVEKRDLIKFAYMLDPQGEALHRGTQERGDYYKARLDNTEDVVHYNLACVRLKEGDQEGALNQVKRATRHGFISKETFEKDPDLKAIQTSPDFEKAISRFPSQQ